ncbi:MAG: hypothetical protein WC810_27980 [Janthinobacterium sp.]|jgi:hypothetical protein
MDKDKTPQNETVELEESANELPHEFLFATADFDIEVYEDDAMVFFETFQDPNSMFCSRKSIRFYRRCTGWVDGKPELMKCYEVTYDQVVGDPKVPDQVTSSTNSKFFPCDDECEDSAQEAKIFAMGYFKSISLTNK